MGRRRLRVTPVKKLSAGVIRLKRLSRRERRRRVRARLPLPLKVLTSLKTTAILATTLGVLAAPATAGRIVVGAGRRVGRFAERRPFTTFFTIPTAVSALAVSPTLRKAVSPIRRGKAIGAAVEDPQTFLQKVAGFFSGAGQIVKETAPVIVPAAIVGAAIIGGRRLARRARDRRPAAIPTAQLPIAALPVGVAPVSVRTTPLGAVTPTEKPVAEEKVKKAPPSIRITNKPQINIRFSKSRKFINQQILVN